MEPCREYIDIFMLILIAPVMLTSRGLLAMSMVGGGGAITDQLENIGRDDNVR